MVVAPKKHLTNEDIEYVAALSRKAGVMAMEMREGVDIREKTGPNDMVTAADCELSRVLCAALKERFPHDTIVSEEDAQHSADDWKQRMWLIDPIDGTDNYISNDGQYSVMIGLLVDMAPVFGWVYQPTAERLYYGGPEYGAWATTDGQEQKKFSPLAPLKRDSSARVIMGHRDRKNHPWLMDNPRVSLIKFGSIGLKVARVLEDHADLYAHLSGKLKTWDTAAPVAIALGGGLDVGCLETDELAFPERSVRHECSVIIGRPGALLWSRAHFAQPTT